MGGLVALLILYSSICLFEFGVKKMTIWVNKVEETQSHGLIISKSLQKATRTYVLQKTHQT